MTDDRVTETRIETSRLIGAPAAAVFAVLTDPWGHVAIDSSGMLQGATGNRVAAAGDSFTIHMDRESLNDLPEMGRYDVTVTMRADFEADRQISWDILGRIRPQIGHFYGYRLESDVEQDGRTGTLATSFYDWSEIHEDWKAFDMFPVIAPNALRATLGILDRAVRLGYARG